MAEEQEKAKELQTKYMEYQMIEQQTKQIQEQLEKFEHQIVEINSIRDALEDLKKAKAGSEMLVPIANGIFVKGKIIDIDELTVNVGSGVAVKKTVDETKTLLASQAKEIQNYKMQVHTQLELIGNKGKALEKELESIIK